MAKAPLLILAAGGTGGHMFPAQSLAEVMLARGWRVKLSTDERGARYTGGFSHAVQIEQVPSATFARGGILAKLVVPFRIGMGILAAVGKMLAIIRDIRRPPSPPGRPERVDSQTFIESLVESFYLVNRGRTRGKGSTMYRRLLRFLTICIEEAAVLGSPAIRDVKDSAWKRYVEPAIKTVRRRLDSTRKLYEDLHRLTS